MSEIDNINSEAATAATGMWDPLLPLALVVFTILLITAVIILQNVRLERKLSMLNSNQAAQHNILMDLRNTHTIDKEVEEILNHRIDDLREEIKNDFRKNYNVPQSWE